MLILLLGTILEKQGEFPTIANGLYVSQVVFSRFLLNQETPDHKNNIIINKFILIYLHHNHIFVWFMLFRTDYMLIHDKSIRKLIYKFVLYYFD